MESVRLICKFNRAILCEEDGICDSPCDKCYDYVDIGSTKPNKKDRWRR